MFISTVGYSIRVFSYEGFHIELEEFNQEENGGEGVSWTSYVYEDRSKDYLNEFLISADSPDVLESQVKKAIDKRLSASRKFTVSIP